MVSYQSTSIVAESTKKHSDLTQRKWINGDLATRQWKIHDYKHSQNWDLNQTYYSNITKNIRVFCFVLKWRIYSIPKHITVLLAAMMKHEGAPQKGKLVL